MERKLKPVLRIESDNVAGSAQFYKNWKRIEPTTEIVSYEYDLEKFKELLPVGYIPQIGDTFLLDPFHKDSYIEIDKFDDYILSEKKNCIGDIARLLGAKSYKYSFEIMKEYERELNADGSVNYKVCEINAQFKKTETSRLNKKYADHDQFTNPSVPSAVEYSKAIEKAKTYGLYTDSQVRHIIDGRNPEDVNILGSRETTFFATSEINTSKDLAFQLSYLKVFDLDGHYSESIKKRYELMIHMKIEF